MAGADLGGRGRQRRWASPGPAAARGRRAGPRRPGETRRKGSTLRHRSQPQDRRLDAHSIAIVAVRTTTLRVLQVDGELEALVDEVPSLPNGWQQVLRSVKGVYLLVDADS